MNLLYEYMEDWKSGMWSTQAYLTFSNEFRQCNVMKSTQTSNKMRNLFSVQYLKNEGSWKEVIVSLRRRRWCGRKLLRIKLISFNMSVSNFYQLGNKSRPFIEPVHLELKLDTQGKKVGRNKNFAEVYSCLA